MAKKKWNKQRQWTPEGDYAAAEHAEYRDNDAPPPPPESSDDPILSLTKALLSLGAVTVMGGEHKSGSYFMEYFEKNKGKL